MTESDMMVKLTKPLRGVPGLTVFRHVDAYTVGIPDYSFTFGDRTIWVEFKLCHGVFSKMQVRNLNRMENSWAVIFHAQDVEWKHGSKIKFEREVCNCGSKTGIDLRWVREIETFRGEVVYRLAGSKESNLTDVRRTGDR